MALEFEWDEEKAIINQRDHKLGFEEAKAVFDDPLATTIPDPDHSIDEYRYLTIGESLKGKLLVVSYTERKGNIRLISCREATPRERKAYEEGDL
jgi:hypothetical protein